MKQSDADHLRKLRAAYRSMLAEPGIELRVGRTARTVYNQRVDVKNGIYPSTTIMRKWLALAGWRTGGPERWAPPGDMLLRDAFRLMLAEREVFRRLGMGLQRIANMRTKVGHRHYPKEETMRSWLSKVGWRCSMEEYWLPAGKRKKKQAHGKRPKPKAR